jgi:hypothetical protein
MPDKHQPDGDRHVHQDYKIEVEKIARDTWGTACRDAGTMLVHDPEEARMILAFLRGLGYAASLERRTKTMLEHDDFPKDEEDHEHGA